MPVTDRIVLVGLVLGVAGFAGFRFLTGHWVSGLAAAVVAGLLAMRHRRGRFSAYILFSALALRGVMTAAWPLVAFAAVSVLTLQTAPARRLWPRLRLGATSSSEAASSTPSRDCSRMGRS